MLPGRSDFAIASLTTEELNLGADYPLTGLPSITCREPARARERVHSPGICANRVAHEQSLLDSERVGEPPEQCGKRMTGSPESPLQKIRVRLRPLSSQSMIGID